MNDFLQSIKALSLAVRPLVADLASTIFFAVLIAVTGNVYLATGIGMAIGIGQLAVQKLIGKQIFIMQWMSLALVIVFGSLTLYLHDPRFVIVKFTIAHVAIGAAMLQPNWMSRYLPPIVTDTLSKLELTLYSAMWPVMMFGLAAVSLYIGLEDGLKAWIAFNLVVPSAAPWVLFGLQYLAIRFHVKSVLKRRAMETSAPTTVVTA
ncbi:MAG TPA: septation protein IspZ [Rhizomicrobium sp.]|jgi:intracellular septation protein A